MGTYHTPVMLDESISALIVSCSGIYADVTLGGGGHSREILKRLDKHGRLIVMDRDTDALNNCPADKRVIPVHNNYRFLRNFLAYHKIEKLDGIIADLGVSSHQFDTEERGFSFRFNSLLDMRMNKLAKKSAADILNSYQQNELADLFRNYGEVENSRRVASLICIEREKSEIKSTDDLQRVLAPVLPKHSEHKYLAKIYQALRIEVNGELKSLELFLNDTKDILKPGGRLVIITYHSLEDRMVKMFMRAGNVQGDVSRDFYGNYTVPFRIVTKKPVVPQEREIAENTRARSAKLRVAEKI